MQAEPLATPNPRRSSAVTSASPSTYRQEKVTRWGSRSTGSPDHLDVRDRRDARPGSGRPGPPAGRRPPSRSATTACRAAAAASAAGTFSKPEARSSMRSSPGKGLRQRAPLRTSSTPTPAGPPHLCAERGQRPPSRRAAAAGPSTAQASTNSGTPRQRAPPPRRPAGRCRPRGWPTGRRRRRPPGRPRRRASVGDVDPARAGRPGRLDAVVAARAQAAACSTAECSTAECTTAVPVPGPPGEQPEQPAVHGVGARGGEGDLVGADAEAARRPPSRALSSSSRADAGRAVQAAGIGVPLLERGQQHLARGGVQRLGGGGVEVDRGAAPGPGRGPAGGICHRPNLVDATRRAAGAPARDRARDSDSVSA